MKKRDHKRLAQRKRKIEKRLDRRNKEFSAKPVFEHKNVDYDVSDRITATSRGGVASIHTMLERLKVAEKLNEVLSLLKIHRPYHESDHILNIAYNVLTGGTRLEDIEDLRVDTAYMDVIGALRIPDPTTSGDFLRRFSKRDIEILMDAMNEIRLLVWDARAKHDPSFYDQAIVEIDGTATETLGECKGGMDISYKGIWGYAPLIVTLANTREVLFIENRPGNVPSCVNAAKWIEKTIGFLSRRFKRIRLRGDTDYSLTEHLDEWDEKGEFVFGYDASPKMRDIADALGEAQWTKLLRKGKYAVKTQERTRPANVKEQIVRQRNFENQRLLCEDIQEFTYKPAKCKKTYRIVVVRKNISVEKGEHVMFDELRYFFYITNDRASSPEKIVFEANERCDQENIIAQLKSGIGALRAPVDNLLSNWAYMVIAAQAWNFKAWLGLQIADESASKEVVRMEYKKFLTNFIQIPCQIIRTGGRIVCRVLAYNPYVATLLDTFSILRKRKFT